MKHGPPQLLLGFRSNEEWSELLAKVDGWIQDLETLPDPLIRDRVLTLLQGVDAIHREALTRLVRLFKKGVLEQVTTDPAIRTLMELYDLMPQRAGCGEIPDFISGFSPPGSESETSGISQRRIADRVPVPRWVPAPIPVDELALGTATAAVIDERALLLCRVGDEVFALADACAQDGAAMDGARLNGFTLACPRHSGCYYDVRRGARIGAAGTIECFPVRVGGGSRVLVGFDMPFAPRLPPI
jgi:nitrite reductase/ring-hydroxylating ferredoxin subunit